MSLLAACAPGTKVRTYLPAGPAMAPVLIARGIAPGRTLAVTAAVHGDEYEGIRAIFEVFDEIDALELAGNLVAVPVANPAAFWNGTRQSPVDGANLARVFPGDPEGTPSQMLAHALGAHVIGCSDFYLDLHSGGAGWTMPSMAGYDASDPRSLEAALLFGAPVVWGHPSTPPGRTVSYAKSKGIPFLYTEARGGCRIHRDDLAMMKRGIRNLLRHQAILGGDLEVAPLEHHLFGDGNIDASIVASADGFFIPAVAILDRIRAGMLVGQVRNVMGETVEQLKAPRDGVLGLVRDCPLVRSGDPLALITDEI
ncbi:MAG: M14 family metallopeptidase [Bryobacteraceae bacterium]